MNRIENQSQLQSIDVYFTKGEIIQALKLYTLLIHAVRKSRDYFVTISYTLCICSQSDTDGK